MVVGRSIDDHGEERAEVPISQCTEEVQTLEKTNNSKKKKRMGLKERTPTLVLVDMRSSQRLDTPSPPSPIPAAFEVEVSSDESFASEEHVEATYAAIHEEGMIDALRGMPIPPRQDEGLFSSAPPLASILAVVKDADSEEDEL
ncbi:hypothetical protein AMTR_s00013p00260770 [Amborella trichopoda]|uniref:Uncharacterized protein n=1 Tax=Amborella trichopoda TaxID=13333 RepID=W1PQV7_AMBTC|nr:hypothetical protein AMTR_s00013p00260770 [Amborella trichopoda]